MGRLRALALVVGLASLAGVAGTDADRPPVLEGLAMPENLQALAVDRGGDRAAVASFDDRTARSIRSLVRLHTAGGGEPSSVGLPGVVRAMLFAETGSVVYALQHRPAKKHEGETFLVSIDFDTLEFRRITRLPPSSRGLDYWPRENALLIAARDEVRTILLPLMRSGPLYFVPGENLSVAAVGGTRILVGQDSALLDVDLSDPPAREGFPSRQRIEMPSPVVSLSLTADGGEALAGLADDTIARIAIDPLRLEGSGTGVLPTRPIVDAVPDVVEPEPATTSDPVADRVPAVPRAEPEPTDRPSAHRSFEGPPVREAPAPSTAGPSEPFPEAGSPEVASAPSPVPAGPVQARGLVSGPAAGLVVAVVFLGPDNILREAARAVPSPAGRWKVSGLEPGRYRVQLDGGGSRVLITEPGFLLLDIAEGREAVGGEFTVLGTR